MDADRFIRNWIVVLITNPYINVLIGEIKMRKWLCLITLIITLYNSLSIAYDQDLLKTADINRIMNQILEHHVDKKEVTGQLLQSSLMTYIDQFDPHRIYLLEEEITPFVHLSSEELAALKHQYQAHDFSIFKKLNQIFQNSIERSRLLRNQIEVNPLIFRQNLEKGKKEANYLTFAKTIPDLKKRLLEQLEFFIMIQHHRYSENNLDRKSTQEQLLEAYEDSLKNHENPYLFEDEKGRPLNQTEKENLFAIHILKALASSLDAHTSFYEANEAYDMRVRLQKEFQGIGLVLKDTNEGAMVSRLLEKGPAAKNGTIQVGDILTDIDGKSIKDESFERIMDMLHGGIDPVVTLSFSRKTKEGFLTSFTVKLKREEIVLNNDRVDTSSIAFGNGIIGVITLHSFYQGDGVTSEKDVRHAIEKLEKKENLRGLILDLRDNNGGFLSQAVKVAGLFITNGIIVVSKYADGEEKFYRDVDGKVAYDGPLVVLTSKATASAAEIVAQALQDYGVAVIVGDKHTYGKGTIQSQTVTDTHSSSYFKVTVGKYYTVSGKTPQKTGVKADIVVPGHWDQEKIGEEYLEASVEPDQISPTFNDTLSDVSPDVKPWYLKYYMPKLQHEKTVWRYMIPTLKKNSVYRVEHNKNYQFYLKGKNSEENEEEWTENAKFQNYGVDDLQLQEAVNIVKDMILLHSLEASPSSFSHKQDKIRDEKKEK
jgi:carboxyl-terminal processing protease